MAKQERLNRFLARAGVASRRGADQLILSGQIRVNGVVADHPGVRVDPETDRVEYHGRPVWLRPPIYIMMHKPTGYLVSRRDRHHDQTVFDLLEDVPSEVFPVGRLDLDTSGVLLLTSDGDLGYRLTHPKYEVTKIYRAQVFGSPDEATLKALSDGIHLEDGVTAPAEVEVIERSDRGSMLRLSLREGKNRQVKRMCREVGHRVQQLERLSFAGVTLGELQPGQWRKLRPAEVSALGCQVGLNR